MTNPNNLPAEDEDACLIDDEDDWDEEFDDLYYSDHSEVLVADQDWEDWKKARDLEDKHPGFILMKIKGYNPTRFKEIAEWCDENATEEWQRIEWTGHCAYTVMVGFRSYIDAVHYQLRWN